MNLITEIDTDNLKSNFIKARNISGCGVNTIPVIKSDAYYVGMEKVVNALSQISPPQKKFFVYSIDEGIRLRKSFNDIEIYVLAGIFNDDFMYFIQYNLTPVINDLEQLELCFKNKITRVILQFNIGMNRSGLNLSLALQVRQFTKDSKMDVIMLMGHLCCADENTIINNLQIENFKKIITLFPEKSILKSLAASDGIINFNLNNICNSCRPGIMLYRNPSGKIIWNIKTIVKSDNGSVFLPVGLNDGFLADYAKNGTVLIGNKEFGIKFINNTQILLGTNDKSLEGMEAIIVNEKTYHKFLQASNTIIYEAIPRLLTKKNCPDNNILGQKIFLTVDNDGKMIELYSTLLEKRIVEYDGVVGYSATEKVRQGQKLGLFAGGYLDGLARCISNTGCTVFVESETGELVECRIVGRISMDNTIIDIPEEYYSKIKVGAKVIIFDRDHGIERFENLAKKTREELFFCADKSAKVHITLLKK
ncbi:MAG: alanine racemase [Rickettsiales bacterium]|jgi:alanine racemase|nr:alanine racemase [Rickettsiales bacterium]